MTALVNTENLLNQALRYYQSNEFTKAADLYNKILKSTPNHAGALAGCGAIELQLGNINTSIKFFKKLVRLFPNQPNGLINLGVAYIESRQYEQAITSFDQAIALNSVLIEVYLNKAVALQELNQLDDALDCCDKAISLMPINATAHFNRGSVLYDMTRFVEAVDNYDAAIAIDCNYSMAHFNKGAALQQMDRFDEAIASYRHAIALNANYAKPYVNLGLLYFESNCYQDAIECFDRAIALKHNSADLFFNQSLLKLLLGDYEEGWKLYEFRWESSLKKYSRNFNKPLWLGTEPIFSKTILIHAEQGLGDTIQFCRYIPMVEALNAEVLVEVPKSLIFLLSTIKGSFSIIEKGASLPDFDFHCPMMSLPLAFKTTVETIPATTPYIYALKNYTSIWNMKLGVKTRPRIGLVWRGSSEHKKNHHRSLLLKQLAPLLQLDIEFHSLQKEITAEDKETLIYFKEIHLHQNDLIDFSDTAALINELDLVISVDTSVAHLTGALGKPIWILLPFAPDFRWMDHKNDSPWYPSARLFRQQKSGDWESAIRHVCIELSRILESF